MSKKLLAVRFIISFQLHFYQNESPFNIKPHPLPVKPALLTRVYSDFCHFVNIWLPEINFIHREKYAEPVCKDI
jgi:hypothetical protein